MSRIGLPKKLADFEQTLTAARMDAFYSATGWQSGPRPSMHPTLATCFRDGEFKAFQAMNIPLASVLHGEQKYEYAKALQADTAYCGETSLVQFYEKAGKGSVMKFYVFRTELKDKTAGALHVACETTIIVREAT